MKVASSDLVNMGITVVSYTLKDIRDEEGYLKVVKTIQKEDSQALTIVQIQPPGAWDGEDCRGEERRQDR